jgi:hypothetical protein
MEIPEIDCGSVPCRAAPIALAIASMVHSAVTPQAP